MLREPSSKGLADLSVSRRSSFGQGRNFILVGTATAALDYLLLYLLTEHAGAGYLMSSAIGFMAGSISNYYLSVLWVFTPGKYQRPMEFTLFILTSLAGLVLNQACMWLLVGGLGTHYLIAKAVALVIVTAWNFISKKTLVFVE